MDAFIDMIINNKYKIKKKISDGGMSIVYLAEGIDDKKKYAIKFLKTKNLSNRIEDIIRFKNEIDVILFDKGLIKAGASLDKYDQLSSQEKEIEDYVQTMKAAEDMSGNFDRYYEPNDLVQGDSLVISSLDILYHADPNLWPEIMQLSYRGVGIEILEYGFDSGGAYGDVMLEKMNKMYEFGKHTCS